MIADLRFILPWLFMLIGLGVTGFPIAWLFFRRLPDGGFGLSPVVGILIPSWMVWMLASVRVLPFRPPTVYAMTLATAISGLTVLFFNRRQIRTHLRRRRMLMGIELGLFCVSFIGWAYVRGFQPDIEGLEKFMDSGFMNSALRADYMPPPDMWLAGETINYYYFGHYQAAFLTKLSGIDPAVTYNLMLATIFALSMVGSFSVIVNAVDGKKAIIGGLFGTLLLNFGANLHPIWFFLSRQQKGYWYPDATRFIPFTIHEFPAYSHVVADLHGHLMDLPVVLLFLVVVIAFLQGRTLADLPRRQVGVGVRPLEYFRFPIILGFLLGVMSMTNTWDVPIYGIVFVVAIGWATWKGRNNAKRWALEMTKTGLILATVATVVSLPFQLHFHNIAEGIALVNARSPLWQLGVLWGGFGVIGLVSVWRFSFGRSDLRRSDPGRWLPIAMTGVSALLILIPEIVYVKDIYIKEYHRANTMFKLTYQSFVMMCLVFGITLGSVAGKGHAKPRAQYFIALFVLLTVFVLHMIYPFFSIKSYYGLTNYKGIYGLQWLAQRYPDDYRAVVWMKRYIKGQPVILEAVGESYTDYDRVSASTGLPTVLGWRVHEWLWRGGFDIPGQRTDEVRIMFEDPDSARARQLLAQYHVRYLFLGEIERKAYHINEQELMSLGTVIYRNGATTIVDLHPQE